MTTALLKPADPTLSVSASDTVLVLTAVIPLPGIGPTTATAGLISTSAVLRLAATLA